MKNKKSSFYLSFTHIFIIFLLFSCKAPSSSSGTTSDIEEPVASYTVTYIITNGSEDLSEATSVSKIHTIKDIPDLPETREGYLFKGWYSDESQTLGIQDFSSLSDDITLYGHWAGTLYTINLCEKNSNGTGFYTKRSFIFSTEDEFISLPVYSTRSSSRSYEIFEGWFFDNTYTGEPVSLLTRSDSSPGSELNLYAKFTEKIYPVFYDLLFDYGVVNPNTVTTIKCSDLYKRLIDPIHEDTNFLFDGWYNKDYKTNSQATKLSTFIVTEREEDSVTFYAKWKKATPTNLDGATVIITDLQNFTNCINKLPSGFSYYILISDKSINAQNLKTVFSSTNSLNQNNNDFYFDFSNTTDSFSLTSSIFANCGNLSGVTLPNCISFTSIPSQAFSSIDLEILNIPNQITTIDQYAFAGSTINKLFLPTNLSSFSINDTKYDAPNISEVYYNSTISDLKSLSLNDKTYSYIPKLFVLDESNSNYEPVHHICFDTLEGTWIDGYTPETVFLNSENIELPDSGKISKFGYDFVGWYESSSYEGTPFTSFSEKTNVKLYAKWSAKTNIPYKVNHYKENLENDDYTLVETETKKGTAFSKTKATSKQKHEFAENGRLGFDVESIKQEKIDPNGNTVINIYYKRKRITFTLYLKEGTLDGETGTITRTGKYYQSVSINNPTRERTEFLGWTTIGGTLPSNFIEDENFYARWNELFGITINVINNTNDLSVTQSREGDILTFESENCDIYNWSLDDNPMGNTNTCIINTSTLTKGVYLLNLEAKKDSKWYSYSVQIKIE